MTRLAVDDSGHPIQMIGQGNRQNVAIGATSSRTATAFEATTNAVQIVGTSDCWYAFGDSSVESATTGANLGSYLPAGAILYQRVEKAVDTHVAVIQDSAAGTLSVTEGR